MRLIDADALMEKLNVFNDREHGNEHFLYGIETAKELLEDTPTTTEADIRAMALGVMGMAMKEFYPSCKGAYVDFDVFFHAVMAKVAEQLKEE